MKFPVILFVSQDGQSEKNAVDGVEYWAELSVYIRLITFHMQKQSVELRDYGQHPYCSQFDIVKLCLGWVDSQKDNQSIDHNGQKLDGLH